MISRLKKALDKIYIKEEYDYVMDEICENNRKIILVLCSVCASIFAVLSAMGFMRVGIPAQDIPVFLSAFIYSAVLLIITKLSSKHNHKAIMTASYLTMGSIVLYGIVVSYRAPQHYTVTFIAMMCIMSMTFADRPIRIGIAHILATALCVGMICIHKQESVLVTDMINVISFSLLSFIGGFYTVKTKVHGYVIDKSQEENLEKGRQKLNAKRIEALQLLTAVKATHDMVVSVNLTQNTYALIGNESFITHGDNIKGVFDDVINIHASKVVPEHRQKYLDTFSRAGLLKAHEDGKREVYLEYKQCDENGIPHWLGTHTMFIDNPGSTDVTEITISQNIDERVKKEEEIKAILQEERDKAEQAQKTKTEFLFQMSHDIRTPMNAIIGFANFIKSSNDLDTIHNDYVVKLETAGQQLLMLINDALEMSRIESGKLVFNREINDIRSIITNVMSVMQIQAEEKGIQLYFDYDVKHPMVNCDQNHLNRVVMNLLSNAVKFTPSGGKVTVSLYEKPKAKEGRTAFELKVADTGIGMSPEFLEKAFEPFEREQTSTVSGMQGTGLGLSIVKRIIDAANDTITVSSKQGEGSVFTVNLSLLRANETKLDSNQSFDVGMPSAEQMADYFKGKRILLVEDNEFNLTIARIILENAGFTVETATDGRMAVDKIVTSPTPDYYNAVLMDIQMPIMDGYEATKEIRALSDDRAKIIIIAVTANAFDTDKNNALAAGMNAHIAKPLDVAALYKTLWNALK